MERADAWCPNCERVVRPRATRGARDVLPAFPIWLFGWLIIGALFELLIGADPLGGWASPALAAVLAVWATGRLAARSCPICGTRRLTPPPTPPHG